MSLLFVNCYVLMLFIPFPVWKFTIAIKKIELVLILFTVLFSFFFVPPCPSFFSVALVKEQRHVKELTLTVTEW